MGVQEAADEAPPALTGALAPLLLATKLAIPPVVFLRQALDHLGQSLYLGFACLLCPATLG